MEKKRTQQQRLLACVHWLRCAIILIIIIIMKVRFSEEINYVLLVVGGSVTVVSTIVCYWSWLNRQRNRLESKTKRRLEAPPMTTMTTTTMDNHDDYHHHDGNNLSCDDDNNNNNRRSSLQQQQQQQQKAPVTKKQLGWLLSNDSLWIHVPVLLFLVGIWIWVLGHTLPVLPSQFWIKTGFGITMGTFLVNWCFFGDCYAAADAHWLLYHDRIRRLGDLYLWLLSTCLMVSSLGLTVFAYRSLTNTYYWGRMPILESSTQPGYDGLYNTDLYRRYTYSNNTNGCEYVPEIVNKIVVGWGEEWACPNSPNTKCTAETHVYWCDEALCEPLGNGKDDDDDYFRYECRNEAECEEAYDDDLNQHQEDALANSQYCMEALFGKDSNNYYDTVQLGDCATCTLIPTHNNYRLSYRSRFPEEDVGQKGWETFRFFGALSVLWAIIFVRFRCQVWAQANVAQSLIPNNQGVAV